MEQDESLTRFANNCIHQNVTERNVQMTVRSVIGTKIGIAVSNDLRAESLRGLAARAYEAASFSPTIRNSRDLPEPQPVVVVAAFDHAVAECHSGAARYGGFGHLQESGSRCLFSRRVHDDIVAFDRRREFEGAVGGASVDVGRCVDGYHGKQFFGVGSKLGVAVRTPSIPRRWRKRRSRKYEWAWILSISNPATIRSFSIRMQLRIFSTCSLSMAWARSRFRKADPG